MTRQRLAAAAATVAMAVAVLASVGCGSQRSGAAPTVVQTINAFHHPESSAFSADGRWLYVTNCASAEFGSEKRVGLRRTQGAISRLAVAEDGTLTMAQPRFVDGLDTPLGIAVAPRAVGPYPAGSLFVCVGNALATDDAGHPVTDLAALGTAVAVFAADTGRALGRIPLGAGSPIAAAIGHPVLLPNGIAFDGEGRLVVADSAAGGERLVPPVAGVPGILVISIGAEGGVAQQRFIPVPGAPNGVAWDASRRSLLWVTCGGSDPDGGALFRDGAKVVGGLGPSDGIVITPSGTIVVSRFAGDLVAIRGKTVEPLPLRFAFPSDIRGRVAADGSCLVVVPEQEAWGTASWGQRVSVLRLPPGF